MATVGVMIGGVIINALVFSVNNYLFLKMSGHREEERKRYHLAIETFTRDRDK